MSYDKPCEGCEWLRNKDWVRANYDCINVPFRWALYNFYCYHPSASKSPLGRSSQRELFEHCPLRNDECRKMNADKFGFIDLAESVDETKVYIWEPGVYRPTIMTLNKWGEQTMTEEKLIGLEDFLKAGASPGTIEKISTCLRINCKWSYSDMICNKSELEYWYNFLDQYFPDSTCWYSFLKKHFGPDPRKPRDTWDGKGIEYDGNTCGIAIPVNSYLKFIIRHSHDVGPGPLKRIEVGAKLLVAALDFLHDCADMKDKGSQPHWLLPGYPGILSRASEIRKKILDEMNPAQEKGGGK